MAIQRHTQHVIIHLAFIWMKRSSHTLKTQQACKILKKNTSSTTTAKNIFFHVFPFDSMGFWLVFEYYKFIIVFNFQCVCYCIRNSVCMESACVAHKNMEQLQIQFINIIIYLCIQFAQWKCEYVYWVNETQSFAWESLITQMNISFPRPILLTVQYNAWMIFQSNRFMTHSTEIGRHIVFYYVLQEENETQRR